MKSVQTIAREVIAGEWGSGDKRKAALTKAGYNYDTIQTEVNTMLASRDATIENMEIWAKKIAADNRYHYNKWSTVKQSHLCPICSGLKYEDDPEHFGWNCIGFGIAVWHHGGGIPCNCNCGVIHNGLGQQIFDAKTDAEALALVKKALGIDDVIIIRDVKNTVPRSKWQAGDIVLCVSNGTYAHLAYYAGNEYFIDSIGSNGKVANDTQIAARSWKTYNAGVLIRYTGRSRKTVAQLAQEVLDGKWGSGNTRKTKLTEWGYNYNAVQEQVNKLLKGETKMAKSYNQLALEVIIGQWGSGDTRKQKLEAAGYNYTAVQKRVTEVMQHMKTRKEAMQPWFDACKAQWEWSYNSKYNWGNWQRAGKTIAASKDWGTCITYPSVVAQRAKMIKEGRHITSSGSDHDNQKTLDDFWNYTMKSLSSINSKYWTSIKYPNKSTAQLVKEGLIKEGDIIGFMGHTTMFSYKDNNGNLYFNNAGHAAGISDNSKAGSNRAVLNKRYDSYKKRLVYGVFSVNTFIVITSCTGGTISYSDRYMAGQDVTITIKPASGKAVKSILVDGKAISPTTSYKINKIDANHIIEVVCDTPVKKTIEQLAQEVLAGKWGSGDARKQNLIAAGYDYDKVQAKVNELLNAQSEEEKKKLIEKLAKEVLAGKWGSGDERKKRLEQAGYDYNAVQKRVNELIAAQQAAAKKGYSGTFPSLTIKKTNQEVINDTIKWAMWIAGDNDFHYGYTNKEKGADAHHNGCYFCGTQRMKKNMLMPEHTYCCNPFVGAAWAHGGCVPAALKLCQKTNSWGFSKNSGYATSSLFTNLGHPAKSSLRKGDVLCRDTHVAIVSRVVGSKVYIVQAGGGDDNKKNSAKWNKSISEAVLSDANYKNFPRVHRFNGSVNTTMVIRHGEVSKRVAEWQAFLDWYFNGQVGKADGYYGDNTLKWTKKFQETEIGKGEGDGIIGEKTIAAAKKVKK